VSLVGLFIFSYWTGLFYLNIIKKKNELEMNIKYLKKIAALLLSTILISGGVNAANYRMNYKVEGLIDPKTAIDRRNASPADVVAISGWHWFADYNGDVISDKEWIALRDGMKEGVKIVFNNGHIAFINKYSLLDASCLPISQIDSLIIGNGRLAWNEIDCDSSGMDYGQLFIRNYQPVYNHNNWLTFSSFSEKEYGKDKSAKFYIR
jgi:hypothetical protein